jgi:hypothetical protein
MKVVLDPTQMLLPCIEVHAKQNADKNQVKFGVGVKENTLEPKGIKKSNLHAIPV